MEVLVQVPVNNLAPPNAISNLGMSREVDKQGQENGAKLDFRSMVSGKKDRGESNFRNQETEARRSRDSNDGIAARDRKSTEVRPHRKAEVEAENSNRNDSKVSEARQPNTKKASRVKEVRNSAVQKLMASLENEFGISAERFSAALAQLPPEVKAMSVENSAPFVIDELGVPADQQVAATEAYINILHQSGLDDKQKDLQALNWSLAADQGGIEIPQELMQDQTEVQALNNNALNTKMTKRQKLNATIDALNRKFFNIQQQRANQSLQSKQDDLALMNEENKSKNSDSYLLNPMMSQRSESLLTPDFNLDSAVGTDYRSIPTNRNDLGMNSMSALETEADLASFVDESEVSALGSLTDYRFDLQDTPKSPATFDLNSLSSASRNSFQPNMNIENNLAKAQRQQLLQGNATQSALAQERDMKFSSLRDLEDMLSAENSLQYSELNSGKELAESNRMWSVEELPFLAQQENNGFSTFAQNSETGNPEGGFNQFQDQGFGNNKLSSAGKNSESKERDSIDQLINEFNMSSEPGQKPNSAALNANKMSSINNVAISPQERVNNIQQLSSAAESLAARGGGEVKVVLAPEGLGTIQLKVSVLEGKVQVEMKAENKDSQKVIESSLSDLRHSLASHNLSVDSVKVDVGSEFSQRESNHQSFSQQQQPDLGRDQARQFMNQFREQNLSQRQSFFEAPGFKSYRSQNDEPLAPVSQEIRPRSSLNSNKGRDLNLIV